MTTITLYFRHTYVAQRTTVFRRRYTDTLWRYNRKWQKEELEDFLDWFSRQPHSHKILIAGNHDLSLEEMSYREKNKIIPKGITYLQSETVTINGINIYASSVSPYLLGMAFNRNEEKK